MLAILLIYATVDVLSTFNWTWICLCSFTNVWTADMLAFSSRALMCNFFSSSVHRRRVVTSLQCAPQEHLWYSVALDLDSVSGLSIHSNE